MPRYNDDETPAKKPEKKTQPTARTVGHVPGSFTLNSRMMTAPVRERVQPQRGNLIEPIAKVLEFNEDVQKQGRPQGEPLADSLGVYHKALEKQLGHPVTQEDAAKRIRTEQLIRTGQALGERLRSMRERMANQKAEEEFERRAFVAGLRQGLGAGAADFPKPEK